MASYVKFRDVSGAVSAGQQLASAGESLQSTVRGVTHELAEYENQVLRGTDDYSREFLREYRSAVDTDDGPSTFNVVLRSNSLKVADGAVEIGNNVVKAAKEYLWVDAVNGAAMFRSAQGG
jgi:hypothetical protein